MNWEIVKRNKYVLCLCAIIVVLMYYKLRFLGLPYYYDEGWPYSIAVYSMYQHGASILPGAIPPFLARGHPLMFHFLAAIWMKIFGLSLVSGHSFALTVSIFTIFICFRFCREFFSSRVGFVSCLLLAVQAIFIAQSTYLMPEMLMAFWTMLCFYSYFKRYYLLFVVFSTSMILTKEPGIVLVISLFFYELILFVFSKEKDTKSMLKEVAIAIAPIFIASIFFIIQKVKYGWFLYPFYVSFISSDWHAFPDKLSSGLAYFFIYYGRNGFSIAMILSIVIIFLYEKLGFTKNERRIISAICCFVSFYLLFSFSNYYISRYLLCAFPPFIIVGSILIDKAFCRYKKIYPLLIVGLAFTSIFYYVNQRNGGDCDDAPSIIVAKDMVGFCESQNLYARAIYTTTLLRCDLGVPSVGYLSGKPFSNIQYEFSSGTEYCIFSRDEYDNSYVKNINNNNKLQLIKRFEYGQAWSEIYRVIK